MTRGRALDYLRLVALLGELAGQAAARVALHHVDRARARFARLVQPRWPAE